MSAIIGIPTVKVIDAIGTLTLSDDFVSGATGTCPFFTRSRHDR